jgi:hypothetical protein
MKNKIPYAFVEYNGKMGLVVGVHTEGSSRPPLPWAEVDHKDWLKYMDDNVRSRRLCFILQNGDQVPTTNVKTFWYEYE